ncbi:unnamed protein product [Penicillium egyptiacum]|uniref:F-box domain-containing protein n=1 Tax=Penicillium egyptiacum TaxID=1303716 RepID=A0A9W4KD07_9EURO|nr:unnamed protein product [Penicillium egyptiacum]
MSFVLLPTELILMIESNLHSLEDRNSFVRTSPRFTLIFEDRLYQDCSAHELDWIILWAAQRGLDGTIRKCLRAGAKITRLDRFRSHRRDRDAPESLSVIPRHPKSHPLTAAAEVGSMSCVSLLLAKGVNPNLLDEHYETPMRQAAGNGHVDIVKLLLDSGPEAFSGAFKLRRPLKFAAARGHLPVLKALFSFLKAEDRILTVKDAAQIILYEGLWHCEESVVRYALEQGADVNDEELEFALRFAPDLRPDEYPMRPRIKLVQSYKFGVTIRGIPTPGWSTQVPNTLHAAMMGGDPDLVELILDQGFNIAHVGPALRHAVLRSETALLSKLMKLGVTVTSKDLYDAVSEGVYNSDSMKKHVERTMEELGLQT